MRVNLSIIRVKCVNICIHDEGKSSLTEVHSVRFITILRLLCRYLILLIINIATSDQFISVSRLNEQPLFNRRPFRARIRVEII